MKRITKNDIFEKELLKLLEMVINNTLSLKDFIQTTVEIEDKDFPIMNVSWSSLRHEKAVKNIFNDKNFNNLILEDKENTIDLFSKALNNDLLVNESILSLFNNIEDKNKFYKKIRSFKTLLNCEKLQIPIWNIIKIKDINEKEIILPLYVWNCENSRFDLKKQELVLDIEGKVNFFNNNKDKWIDVKTNHTSNEEFISRLAYRIATEEKHKNYIKYLGLKLNDEHSYIFNNGKSQKIKELILKQGLLKIVVAKNSPMNPLDIINLVCSRIPFKQRSQPTTQKRFAKLWFKHLQETDFSYMDKAGNLANHSLLDSSRYYLPLNDPYNSDKISFVYDSTNKKLALYKWLTILYEKDVDFTNKNENGQSALSEVLALITINNFNNYESYFDKSSFLIKIWDNLDKEQKSDIFLQYMENWDRITKTITNELTNKKNTYQSPHIISNVLNLFTESDILEKKEINSKIINFLKEYENINGMESIIIKITHQQYKISLPIKEITDTKKIKI